MADVTPFLDLPTFTGMFRPLSTQEQSLATLLLNAAAVWIRDPSRSPGLDSSDPMAQLVTYQVVRDALAVPMALVGHLAYERGSDNRTEGGTLAAAADLLNFTEHHRELLGLSGAAAPTPGGFNSGFPMPPAFDYGGQYAGVGPNALIAYQTDATPYGPWNGGGWL